MLQIRIVPASSNLTLSLLLPQQYRTQYAALHVVHNSAAQNMLPCRYYVDVAPCDVQAVLENHCSLSDIDVTKLPRLSTRDEDANLDPPDTPHIIESE